MMRINALKKRRATIAWQRANQALPIHKREPMLDRLPYVSMPLASAIDALTIQSQAARELAKLCGVQTP